MNPERIYKVLLGPHISEKATIVAEGSEQVVFRVAKDATKPEIKKAVEELFKVKVTAVNTLRSKGKVKRFKGHPGRLSDSKKAVVTLAEGDSIDVSVGV